MTLRVLLLLMLIGTSVYAENAQKKLFNAIKSGKKKVVVRIINENPDLLNSKIEYHTYPLLEALSKSKWEIALLLLEKGADVKIKDELVGGTPIQCLAKKSYRINTAFFQELVSLLIKNGANVNAVNRNGKTPLGQLVSFAVPEKKLPMFLEKISILLKYGAKLPQKENPILFNVLDAASRSKAGQKKPLLEVFKVLVDNGADIHAKNAKGYNLLMKLFLLNSKHISISERIKFADFILDQGVDINEVTPEKNTVLHLLLIDRYKAVSYTDKLNLTEYLITNGAKTTLKNKNHQSAKKLAKKTKKLYQVVLTTKKKKNHTKLKRK